MQRETTQDAILVINCGSSSVKFALFADTHPSPRRVWSGALERIGLDGGRFLVAHAEGPSLIDESRQIADHASALRLLLSTLEQLPSGGSLVGVGHRVVHGGPECDCHLMVDEALIERLCRVVPLAPLHLPHNLAGIAAVQAARPDLPQMACFDTAFHHDLPALARMTSLPRRYQDDKIRRYGFHGLSYEYVMMEILRRHGVTAAGERIVIAHLGNGASMAAMRDGRTVETTMGFSTLAGLPMGTRSGDVDPGIIFYLLSEVGMTVDAVQHLLYRDSGLLGISGISRNMADLLAQRHLEPAREAVDFFCYRARGHLAALTAALGGLDRVVFTGGIGANSADIRAKICEGLEYLGILPDDDGNRSGTRTISVSGSTVAVEALQTDEELMIARHVCDSLADCGMAQEA